MFATREVSGIKLILKCRARRQWPDYYGMVRWRSLKLSRKAPELRGVAAENFFAVRHHEEWEEREKEWRERDALRTAAIRDPREPGDQEVRSL